MERSNSQSDWTAGTLFGALFMFRNRQKNDMICQMNDLESSIECRRNLFLQISMGDPYS